MHTIIASFQPLPPPGAIPLARRKRTDTEERLTARLHFKVTPTERRKVHADAAKRGISLSDHARRRLLRRAVEHGAQDAGGMRRNPEAAALCRQVLALGVNMNQIAHLANATGRLDDVPELRELCREIKAVFARIMTL